MTKVKWKWKIWLTKVKGHCDENDESEPDVEGNSEVDDGDNDVDDGRGDAEDDVAEQAVDGVGSAVHDPEHLASLAGQVPPKTQPVQVGKHADLEVNSIFGSICKTATKIGYSGESWKKIEEHDLLRGWSFFVVIKYCKANKIPDV